ncbi:MAG: hypothetical protein SFU91_11455 [Chloroherpetonaceae bacterium]|nr:hypothetical protein [Chloroherpetonaceae bacterium]
MELFENDWGVYLHPDATQNDEESYRWNVAQITALNLMKDSNHFANVMSRLNDQELKEQQYIWMRKVVDVFQEEAEYYFDMLNFDKQKPVLVYYEKLKGYPYKMESVDIKEIIEKFIDAHKNGFLIEIMHSKEINKYYLTKIWDSYEWCLAHIYGIKEANELIDEIKPFYNQIFNSYYF